MQNSDRLQSTVYVDNTKYYGSSNKLIVLSNGQITEYDLAGMKKDRLFFGSSMQCDIVINDPVISEIQGKIKLVNDMVYVGDMDDSGKMYLYRDRSYHQMFAKKYYVKQPGDMFIRIAGSSSYSRQKCNTCIFKYFKKFSLEHKKTYKTSDNDRA